MKKLTKLLVKIILSLCLLLSVLCGVLLKKGYDLYQSKITNYPIALALSDIKESDNYVSYDGLPLDYINAVISVEDHRYFYRNGIDIIAVVKALWDNVTSQKIVRGGSTISQQLIKNIYFDMSQTMARKTAEIFFVNDIESKYSKEELFAYYVSIIYFGDNYYGIKQASLGYLNKDYTQLTTCEAALLAGLPQAPSVYQLSNNDEKTYQRYLQVLAAMLKYEHIDQSQYDYCVAYIPGEIKQ